MKSPSTAALMAVWFGIALLGSLFALFSIQVQQEEQRHARIAMLISLLDHRDEPVRKLAADELTAIGGDAVEPLRQAIRDLDPARHRPEHLALYNRLAICQPGGEWTNDLQLSLRADLDAVRPGDTVTFTTTVCNLDNEPCHLAVAQGEFGHFEAGWGLRRIPEADGPLEFSPSCDDQMALAQYLRGIRWENLHIDERSSLSFTMPAMLVCEKGRYFFRLGPRQTHELELPAEGIARFRTVFSIPSEDQDIHVPRSISPGLSNWNSLKMKMVTVRSNDVVLRILPPDRGYLPLPRPLAPAPVPILTLRVRSGSANR
jgi:hypothetical protein